MRPADRHMGRNIRLPERGKATIRRSISAQNCPGETNFRSYSPKLKAFSYKNGVPAKQKMTDAYFRKNGRRRPLASKGAQPASSASGSRGDGRRATGTNRLLRLLKWLTPCPAAKTLVFPRKKAEVAQVAQVAQVIWRRAFDARTDFCHRFASAPHRHGRQVRVVSCQLPVASRISHFGFRGYGAADLRHETTR